jgi:hypothetical protein
MFQPGFLGSGRATRTFNGSATALPAGGTPFTFNAVPIGAASPDRLVVIALMMQANDVASVTIGGIAATKAIGINNGTTFCELWIAAVPTGTTANVALGGGSGTNPRLCIASYSLYGASAAPLATATDITSTYDANLAFGANCVVIGAFTNAPAIGSSDIWTGLTEDVDAVNSNTNFSAASIQDVSGSLAINVTPSALSTGALVCAAWGP